MTTATNTTRPTLRGARGLIALFTVPFLLAPTATGRSVHEPAFAVPLPGQLATAPEREATVEAGVPPTAGAGVTYSSLAPRAATEPAPGPVPTATAGDGEPAAEVRQAALAPPARADVARADRNAFTFAVGDRLELRLFERYGGEPGGPAISTLVEFQEVSGDYVVQQDGTIFLPLLGAVDFADRTPAEVRAEVIETYRAAYAGTVEFTSRALEREPVYVAGAVANPGVYRHTPGMTVLHALTLAGGLPGDDDALLWQRVDLSRERERLEQANLALGRLYAESAVLEAESHDHPASPTPALVALVGTERADELVDEAAALRATKRARAHAEAEALVAVIAALEQERAVLGEALAAAEAAVEIRAGRVDFMENVRDRGLTNFNNFNSVTDGLITAEQRWHETRLALARVERELAQAHQARTRAEFDAQLERDRTRRDLKVAIAEHETTRSATAGLLAQVNLPPLKAVDAELEVVVVRRGAGGEDAIVVNADAPLAPGDLIRVRTPTPEAQSVGLF